MRMFREKNNYIIIQFKFGIAFRKKKTPLENPFGVRVVPKAVN